MSTQEHRTQPLTYSRALQRRTAVLNVDLNAVPPSDNRDQVGPSTRFWSQDCETSQGVAPPPSDNWQVGPSTHVWSQDCETSQRVASVPSAPIDLEAFDDDVMISSPRAFAEAKNNSRRNHGHAIVVDIDSEEQLSRSSQNSSNKRRRISTNQTFINYGLYINLEAASTSARDDANFMVSQPPPPSPPLPPSSPKEPTFNCPVCMGPLVEEMSTKCGHIFCKACIKSAIEAQNKCPTCRRRVFVKDLIRIYLPATS